MPSYPLVCERCSHAFSHHQSLKVPLLRKCPSCGGESLVQDYAAKRLIVNDGVPRTVGQQAEKNMKEMGRELHQLAGEKILGPKGLKKKNAETPWWREKGSKPLDVSRVKDVQKFILTGDKS